MRTSVFTFSDGHSIPYYEWTSSKEARFVIVGIHGITPDLDQWNILASNLVADMDIDVHIPVLRGYKPNKKSKGHIPILEQYDLDLREIVKELLEEYDQIMMIGHSAGCGNVLRALHFQQLKVKTCLLSPFIHPEMDVFNTRDQSEENDSGSYELYQKRAVGAHMLSKAGIRSAELWPVVQVPLREKFLYKDSAVIPFKLSYRLMMGRFLKPEIALDLIREQRIPIIIGNEDEVIDAKKLSDLFTDDADGVVDVIQGVNHNTVFDHPESLSRIMTEVKKVFFGKG